MKTFRQLLPVVLAGTALFSARATTVIPPTFDELVQRAEVIVEGTVTNVQSQFTGEGAQRHIVTYVTLKVEDSMKGAPGATYTMRMLGGTVGDQTLEVSDAPKFKVGDHDILFIENNGSQFIPLVGIMHGRFQLERDSATGNDLVLEHTGKALTDVGQLGLVDEGAKTNTNAIERPLDAEAFKAAIRNKVAATR